MASVKQELSYFMRQMECRIDNHSSHALSDEIRLRQKKLTLTTDRYILC
jgi:hypothetical protein